MSQKCINYLCISKLGEKFLPAQQSVCNYYHVPYKPYQQVCGDCLEVSIKHFYRLGKQMKSQKCIFNNIFHARHIYIELSDEETEDNIATLKSSENTQETDLSNFISTVWYKTIKHPVDVQLQKCKDYVNTEKHKITETNNHINNLIQQINKDLGNLHCCVYKFDSCRQFQYDNEVNIIDDPKMINRDDDEVMLEENDLIELPEGEPRKHSLKSGGTVYAQKLKLQPWFKATVQKVCNSYCKISFNDDHKKVWKTKNVAYINASNTQYQTGSRVIAKYKDVKPNMKYHFREGIIAEPPKHLNKFRYMVFFDDGCTQYVYHEDIRLICYQSKEESYNVPENIKEFVKAYFNKYPYRKMVNFKKNQLVRAKIDTKWNLAKVINTDASLVQLKFLNLEFEHLEWMYRGSNRLHLIYKETNKSTKDKQSRASSINVCKTLKQPYIVIDNATHDTKINYSNKDKSKENALEKCSIVELSSKQETNSGIIKIIDLPPNRTIPYIPHACSHFCMLWVSYDYSKTKTMNTLSIPLHFGFERTITKSENLESHKVVYKTPCGIKIYNINEMYDYLKIVGYGENIMKIDFFNFDHFVNPLALYTETKYLNYIDDISNKMEFKPISVVNCFNHSSPPTLKYITEREMKSGVNLNLDTQFLCSCDCNDNCENKTKCSCWQLTYEYQKKFPLVHKDNTIGYNYKRLYETVYTGIYECNANCKCMKTCLNRVVQEPLSSTLQVFLTKKKGWGVRTLVDIPKGSFICTYIGAVYTEKEAEMDGIKYGDEYLAELDYIETVEKFKEGYENGVHLSDTESDNKTSSSDEEEEFHPGQGVKSIMPFESKMSLRQNIQNTSKKTYGKHQLSELNTKQTIETRQKSLRAYLDDSCGIYILDAKVSGNVGRYFNHSCDPNIFVQNVFVDSHDLRFPWVAYFALTYIPAGTELTWDYSYTIGSVENKKLICYCESNNCKGRLI